ncbi:MAG: hypothetical protein ACOX0A_07285 [Thermoguttaceae bacterium]|jgi:hypothetical protein
MRRERILEYLYAALVASGAADRDAPVVGPNEIGDFADVELFFQIGATERGVERETERTVVLRCDGAIVVNARLGDGVEELDAVVERIERFFAPNAPGAKGFSTSRAKNVARPDARAAKGEARKLGYVTRVRRGSPEIVDGRCKTTVHIEFEIYEEE